MALSLQKRVSNQELHDFLREIDVLEGIRDNEPAINRLISLLSFKNYSKDEVIFSAGSLDSQMYFLYSGCVDVFRMTQSGERYRVATFDGDKTPSSFGEGAVVDTHQRITTIVTRKKCSMFLLHQKDFHNFCNEHPEWGMPIVLKISSVLSARLRKLGTEYMLVYKALVDEIRGHRYS